MQFYNLTHARSIHQLDPANHRTIVDLQNEAAVAMMSSSKGKRKAHPPEDEDDDDDATFNRDSDAIMADVNGNEDLVSMTDSRDGILAIRAKLQTKIASLKRGGPVTDEAGNRDELLDQRRRQRAALREKRRKETNEKIKKEKEGKQKKEKSMNVAKSQLLVPDNASRQSGPRLDPSHTNVAFSTIAGASSQFSPAKKLQTSSNPVQALDQLASRKAHIEKLPNEKRKSILEREKYLKAEARLSGVKIHDSEARLQKAVKRKEKEKGKSKKEWDDRKEAVANNMAAKQKKRTDNIAMRNEKKRSKVRGKGRPGFEGKSFGGSKKTVKKR